MRLRWPIIVLTLFSCASPTLAGNVGDQFSGIQQLQLPGGPLVESKVFVDRGRVRIETSLDGRPGFGPGLGLSPSTQIILVYRDQNVIYFLDPLLKQAKRADLKHPFPLMVPGYLHVALLTQDEILGNKLIWEKLAENSTEDGKECERYRVIGIPKSDGYVCLLPGSKLPHWVAYQLGSIVTKPMKWSSVQQGPQPENLFTLPPDYQISDIPLPLALRGRDTHKESQ